MKLAMAKRNKLATDTRNWSSDFADGGKDVIDLSDEIQNSMQEYIDFTLTNRALPYIDGLKPVHKAILWCMWTNGYKSNGLSHKSATIAGACIGTLWPHSASACYLASAGMTRDKADDTRCGACKLNLSLIDGHGNFGASFEDSPASERYTEQKLSKNGETCVRDAENGAVFMLPSFDAKHTLPELAPVEMPLLLINGSDGLAYGYNVSWLPHNPSEAIRSVIERIDHPDCTVDDIIRIMPGPDFPSGGMIVDDGHSIRDAYESGMGTLTLTSRYEIVPLSRGRHAIDFYETPYGVSRSGDKSIVSGITAFAQDNPSCGITSVKNLSGGDNDCLIEVTVKSGIDAQAVADMLVSTTSCMLTQGVAYRQSAVIGDFERTDVPDATKRMNMLRLCHQKPCDLGMLEYLDAFIAFRKSCVINACEYEREQTAGRKHLVDGLLKALIDIDAVIDTIRHSANKDTARTNLKKKFKLDDEQADYILAIPLARLTRSDKIKLEGNSKDMAARISEIDGILSSEANVLGEVRRELVDVLDAQTLPRRTDILTKRGIVAKAAGDDAAREKQARHSASVLLGGGTASPSAASGSAGDGGVQAAPGVSGSTNVGLTAGGEVFANAKRVDGSVLALRDLDVRTTVLLVFDDGSSIRMPAYELPTKPTIVSRRCVGIVPLGVGDDARKGDVLVGMVTSAGKVKVLDTTTLTKSAECPVISLGTGDSLLAARAVDDSTQFVIVTSDARLLTFPTSSVNKQGRTSAGVAGINLNGAKVVYGCVASPDASVLTSTASSSKVTPLSEYPTKGRGTGGVRCQKFLRGESGLSFAFVGTFSSGSLDGKPVEVAAGKRDASGQTKQPVNGVVC